MDKTLNRVFYVVVVYVCIFIFFSVRCGGCICLYFFFILFIFFTTCREFVIYLVALSWLVFVIISYL